MHNGDIDIYKNRKLLQESQNQTSHSEIIFSKANKVLNAGSDSILAGGCIFGFES